MSTFTASPFNLLQGDSIKSKIISYNRNGDSLDSNVNDDLLVATLPQ